MALLNRRKLLIAAAVVAVPLIVLGWWLFSPLLFDEEVDEAFPLAANALVPDDMTAEEVENEMKDAADQPPVTADDGMPEEGPTPLRAGVFRDADSFHQGSGRATIYELEDGSRVLRLEALEVTNGPDLHVYLVPDPRPEGGDDIEGYLDLGELKGNVGNQNYELPLDAEIGQYGSVVIYCEPFHVVFSTATLNDP
jgi:hypothetical protein